MILPAKHLRPERALLGIGAEILAQLSEPRTISELWERVRAARGRNAAPITYDWFILAASFLYAVAAVEYADGIVTPGSRQ